MLCNCSTCGRDDSLHFCWTSDASFADSAVACSDMMTSGDNRLKCHELATVAGVTCVSQLLSSSIQIPLSTALICYPVPRPLEILHARCFLDAPIVISPA